MTYQAIENYGMIGGMHTVALVGAQAIVDLDAHVGEGVDRIPNVVRPDVAALGLYSGFHNRFEIGEADFAVKLCQLQDMKTGEPDDRSEPWKWVHNGYRVIARRPRSEICTESIVPERADKIEAITHGLMPPDRW